MRIGVATLQHGRRTHLLRQAEAVAMLPSVCEYLVVTMDGTPAPPGARSLELPVDDPARLPLARARNLAVEALSDCDLVVMLDVDCVPDPGLVDAYRAAAEEVDLRRSVLMGPVGWLKDAIAAGRPLSAARRRQARLSVKRGFPTRGIAAEPRAELFWSLSFAVSPAAHARIGGFDEAYRGWGAEDTDYGRRAVRCGVALIKAGGAWAYHQPHPPARRSSQQIAALVENAIRFHARWGDWPAPDVLAELTAAGRIAWSADGVPALCAESHRQRVVIMNP